MIFNVTGFEVGTRRDFRSGETIITDKNKKLADYAVKNGTLVESAMKTSVELSRLIADKVAARGGMISFDNAKELAEMCLCDELTIAGEIEKLCAYADGREITRDMLAELVHVQNDTTIYTIANAVAAKNAMTIPIIACIKVGPINVVIPGKPTFPPIIYAATPVMP